MNKSFIKASVLSLISQIGIKGVNLIAGIWMIRWLAPELTGFFTAVVVGAQIVCTVGRAGTNYSYTTLIHGIESEKEKGVLTRTFTFFSLLLSSIVSIIAAIQVGLAGQHGELTETTFLILLIGSYYLIDSFSETLWDIKLAHGKFRLVFTRNVYISIAKNSLPLSFALLLPNEERAAGICAGLIMTAMGSLIICIRPNKNSLLKLLSYFQERASTSTERLLNNLSFKWLKALLARGLPGFSVPLTTNIILWPIILSTVGTDGFSALEGLRIGQICAQLIALLTGSVIPVLLVKTSLDPQGSGDKIKSVYGTLSLLTLGILALYVGGENTIIPLVFGSNIGQNTLIISRLLVIGAAANGLSQIPLQQVFNSKKLIHLSLCQVISIAIAALTAIQMFTKEESLVAYGYITAASPILFLIILVLINKKMNIIEMRILLYSTVILSGMLLVTLLTKITLYHSILTCLLCLTGTIVWNKPGVATLIKAVRLTIKTPSKILTDA